MSKNLKDELIQSLIDQKEIFGDDLFESDILKSRKTEIIKNTDMSRDSLFQEDWEKAGNLEGLDKLICNCRKCPLGETRNKFVFGTGNPNADAMCIGEGPGADEDAQGLPFVGRAGRLLTDILKAIKFERDDVYIANVVKCRPPGNRTPLPVEMDTCLPYLKKQIELIKPKTILCLGLTAAQAILKKRDSLTNMRGKIFDFENTKVMVTYHPAALLRNPNWKRGCWEDVQKFRKLYDELTS
jgi:uracil-DNA glycosylase family 4